MEFSELNASFYTGLACGVCIGASLFALRKYCLGRCVGAGNTAKKQAQSIELVKTNHMNLNTADLLVATEEFLYPTPEYGFTSNEEYKLAIIVRTDLNMTKGKIAAQCGHASVDAFRQAQLTDPEGLKLWMKTEQTKVALKTDSLQEIEKIEENARKMGIITSLFRDEGRTQIAPNTVTVLGVGPAPRDVVDQVTGHLKLL